jgi:hypothetical protein
MCALPVDYKRLSALEKRVGLNCLAFPLRFSTVRPLDAFPACVGKSSLDLMIADEQSLV